MSTGYSFETFIVHLIFALKYALCLKYLKPNKQNIELQLSRDSAKTDSCRVERHRFESQTCSLLFILCLYLLYD